MTDRYNMICDQGASFARDIVVADDQGAAVPLVGYTAEMHVRKSHSSSRVIVALVPETGRVTIAEAEGIISLSILKADTASLVPGRYVYDLLLVAPNGVGDRILEGDFIVTPGVTRVT